MPWVWLVGYTVGVVGGSWRGLWWLGRWVTIWVMGVMGCSLLVCFFVGLLALYREERDEVKERERDDEG